MDSAARNNGATSRAPMRALVVDDEPHARRYLCELLGDEPEVLVVGEATSAADGNQQIEKLSPDLVFLDIQLPDMDGISLVEGIESAKLPLLIFVTGYSEYAVKAFELEAVDYLCKPFDKERLQTALDRASKRMCKDDAAAGVDENRWLSRLSIRNDDGIVFVPVEQILWIEAANKYVVVHTSTASHIARHTIQGLTKALNPKQFVRIHRSTLVRKSAVRGLHPLFHGDYLVKLANGAEVTLSRSYRASFFHEMSC
jgi:two-component system, LytTR family, response regulator